MFLWTRRLQFWHPAKMFLQEFQKILNRKLDEIPLKVRTVFWNLEN